MHELPVHGQQISPIAYIGHVLCPPLQVDLAAGLGPCCVHTEKLSQCKTRKDATRKPLEDSYEITPEEVFLYKLGEKHKIGAILCNDSDHAHMLFMHWGYRVEIEVDVIGLGEIEWYSVGNDGDALVQESRLVCSDFVNKRHTPRSQKCGSFCR
jgi:hypothetical protein